MSTCRWTGRPRSEWSASNRPIAPTIGRPAHFYVSYMSATSAAKVRAAFSPSNCEAEPTCNRAERNTRTASNDADIRPSLVRLGAQNGPQRRPFRAVPRRLPQQPDSVAERGGFEPSRPFISHMLPRFHAHFLSPERKSRRQNEVRRRSSTTKSGGPQRGRFQGLAVAVAREAAVQTYRPLA